MTLQRLGRSSASHVAAGRTTTAGEADEEENRDGADDATDDARGE